MCWNLSASGHLEADMGTTLVGPFTTISENILHVHFGGYVCLACFFFNYLMSSPILWVQI